MSTFRKIEAIIRTSRFHEVKDALGALGIDFFTYYAVKAVGNQKDNHAYKDSIYDMGSIPRTKIELVVEENLEEVVSKILSNARTGQIGDGKIYIYSIENIIKIRTSESGKDALGA